MCLKHLKPGSHLWITSKHKHKAKHKRRIQAWSKHKRKHKHKKKKYFMVILLVSLCSVNIRETSANNSVVDSVHSARAYFTFSCSYQFTCVSMHSFFMLVLVLVLISQVQLIHLTTVITLFRIISHLCQFDYFLFKICSQLLRGWLHETGMNSDREEFRSVPIQILLSDYMRPVQKLNSDRDDSFR